MKRTSFYFKVMFYTIELPFVQISPRLYCLKVRSTSRNGSDNSKPKRTWKKENMGMGYNFQPRRLGWINRLNLLHFTFKSCKMLVTLYLCNVPRSLYRLKVIFMSKNGVESYNSRRILLRNILVWGTLNGLGNFKIDERFSILLLNHV